jgi:hypothetical protein
MLYIRYKMTDEDQRESLCRRAYQDEQLSDEEVAKIELQEIAKIISTNKHKIHLRIYVYYMKNGKIQYPLSNKQEKLIVNTLLTSGAVKDAFIYNGVSYERRLLIVLK